ncbi:DUF4328 domain-containing protein [Nonomuraea sp. NPDC052116]|uniref:DUF4328 domain-containing protein n=1 Tax=Nonomuraea sp. NPDC052116 TaxID=3155665 RepID=UPI0034328F71
MTTAPPGSSPRCPAQDSTVRRRPRCHRLATSCPCWRPRWTATSSGWGWLIWFARVRTVAERLAPGQLRYRLFMVVVGWFIPVGSVFLPKQIANDVWHASSPPGRGGGMAPAGLLHAWWFVWLATFFFGSHGR